jgi:hypothetical protein
MTNSISPPNILPATHPTAEKVNVMENVTLSLGFKFSLNTSEM